MVGHADNLLAAIAKSRNKQEAERWKEILNKPFPKLIDGYQDAGDVFRRLHSAGCIGDLKSAKWYELHGYPDDPEHPVSGRLFCYQHIVGNVQEKDLQPLRETHKELIALGCNLIMHTHPIKDEGGSTIGYDLGLFLPHKKLTQNRQGEYEIKDDIAGAEIMLAYLMDKGLITQADLPKSEVDEQGHKVAFGPVIQMLARSEAVQRKLHPEKYPAIGEKPESPTGDWRHL